MQKAKSSIAAIHVDPAGLNMEGNIGIQADHGAPTPRRVRILLSFAVACALASEARAANFDEGASAYRDGHYSKAVQVWSELGKQGDVLAQYNLGVMYFKGLGVTRNYRQALQWFTSAARKGVAPAFVNLATMFEHGYGVRQDRKRAFVLMTVGRNSLLPGRCRDFTEERLQLSASRLTPTDITEAVREAKILGSVHIQIVQSNCFESVALPKMQHTMPADVAATGDTVDHGRTHRRTDPELAAGDANADSKTADTPQVGANARAYFVQVASLPTKERAEKEGERLKQAHLRLLGGLPVTVRSKSLKDLGTVFRVRVGPLVERAKAEDLCDKLRANAQECFVIREISGTQLP